MQLAERHVISKNDPRYAIIDAAAFASKNLWNAANYLVQQAFIHEQVYLEFAVHPVRMTLMKHTKHVAVMRALMLQPSVIPARIIVSISEMPILGERSLRPQSGWHRQKETESLKVEEVDGKKAF